MGGFCVCRTVGEFRGRGLGVDRWSTEVYTFVSRPVEVPYTTSRRRYRVGTSRNVPRVVFGVIRL